MNAEDDTREDTAAPSGACGDTHTQGAQEEAGFDGFRRIPVEKAKAIGERVFAEHAELFRRLAQ